jgi:four helix bundle protein
MVYQNTGRFPATERFGLAAQMRRAAVSIPSNIAEGHSRSGSRDFMRFLSIALGSVAEVETQTIISTELGFLQSAERDDMLAQLDSIGKMLRGLQKSIEPYCVKDIDTKYVISDAWHEEPFDSEQSSLEPPVSNPEV